MIKTYTHRQTWLVPLVVLFSLCSYASSWAQPCAPNCRDVNVPIYSDRMGTEFHAKIFWNDVLRDFDCVGPLDFMVTSQQGVLFAQGSSTDVGNEMYFIVNNICPYSDKTLLLMITNSVGTCQSELTFTTAGAKLMGRSYVVYCDDPLLNEPVPGSGPLSIEICKGIGPPTTWVSDWPETRSCTDMGSDTAKIVYREWATTDADGHRRTAMDTMYVLRFPDVSPDNFFCNEKDTVYCSEKQSFGPYVLVPSTTTPNTCDTVRLLKISNSEGALDFELIDFSDKCGLTLHLEKTAFGEGCSQQYYVELDIKQDCGSTPDPNCTVSNSTLEPLGSDGTYWRCIFWLSLLDTVAPIATCDLSNFSPGALIWPMGTGLDSLEHCWQTPIKPGSDSLAPVVLLSTKVHECAATVKLPPLCVYDECNDVQAVKASIEGVGTYVLSQGDSCTGGFTYAYDQGVHLPMREMPYQVVYEVLDQCHNVDTVYCYLQIKDVSKPVAVSEKGVIVNLSAGSTKYEKKTWVDASTFDEGSWDNCGIALMLARRSDWYEFCINLCDSIIDTCTYHGMDLKLAYLDVDSENPVEAHYAREMKWLEEDGQVCSQLLLDAWKLDLLYFGSASCGSFEHDRESFSVLLEGDFCDLGLQGSPGRLFGCTEQDTIHEGRYRKASLLGGGWTKAVPFDCADACSNVTVELLVMDYWCNWSKSWTDVWVEDQNPITIVQDLSNVEISCQSFRTNTHNIEGYSGSVSIETLVDAAAAGETAALNGLDEILGGYEKGWIDSYGNVVDDEGVRLDSTLYVEDSICICNDSLLRFKIYDKHLGEIWKDSMVSFCYYDKKLVPIDRGLIAVNCSEGVICDQTVWADIDHCGQGYIYRKFSISASCPSTSDGYSQGHLNDTITKMQSIWVGNSCELDVGMFDLPGDQTIYTCGITYADDRSGHVTGDADPTLTGRPTYKFDDDCRIVGIAHEDKVFRVVGGDQACFKLIRTWYLADWCHQEKPATDSWWKRDGITMYTFVQKILVVDTLAPVCIITGPVEDGGTIDAAGCVYNLSVVLDAMDACGSLSYYYELRDITDTNEPEVVRQGRGEASDGTLAGIEISEEELDGGRYRLVVYVTDQCQNEGICTYEVTIFTGKKPSPVCISSLAADLVPMDLNGDGTIDTAMSVVWAKEFDASSTAPCGYADEDLKFFIEVLGDGNGAFETLDTTIDKDRLELGCQHLGFNTVRFWVLSPSGSVDFCDVTLVVQNNMGGCPEVVQQVATISGQILTEDDLPVPAVSLGSISTQGFGQQDLTDDLGMFSMMSLMGDSVVITPSKVGTPQNGVSTADILPIFFHANQTMFLESPYLRIAADVNGDKIVNATDLLEVRNMVLGNITEWSGSPNWKFIRSDYVFTSEVPESEDYAKSFAARLVAEQNAANFIGMKTGDMDLDRGLESSRNAELVVMEGADTEFLDNGEAAISLSLPQRDFAGIQLSLRYDPAKLSFDHFDLSKSIAVDELNFGWNEIEEGLLAFSWINAEPNQQLDGDAFLTLAFKTRGSGKLSDYLTLGDRRIRSEAYGRDWEADPIALRFISNERKFSLQQNQPNPFKAGTDIPFELGGDGEASLVIHDVRGRLITKINIDAFEGQHMTHITAEDIGGQPGIYYYTLMTSTGTDTKKMVLLK